MAERLSPTNVAQVGDELAIAWSDGTATYLGLETLRRNCPCAVCGGEPDVLGRIERPEVRYTAQSFILRGWRFVGGYAIQPEWNDGHNTGLYTFPYLKKIESAAGATS
jgi:DUF971 family protein